jgi:alkaline phosphatase
LTLAHELTSARLELDDTVKATIEKLTALGVLNETLIIVTADHGHGFDVFGSVDTKYLDAQPDDRTKRSAVGVYRDSGLSQYTVTNASISYNTGVNFPVNWEPRYVLAEGVVATPDNRQNYKVHKAAPRLPATNISAEAPTDYYVNPADADNGITYNGTIPTYEAQGVHSLTDVPVFAQGPCQELFGGVYGNIDIFFAMAECLGLARENNATGTLGNGTKTEQITSSAVSSISFASSGLAVLMAGIVGAIFLL